MDGIRIRQALARFMDLWRSGVRVSQFPNGLGYEQLRGPECLELRIKQIRAASQYRVAFVIHETDDPRIVFVAAYIKNRQPAGIQDACRRARRYFESEDVRG